jgi:hypothetical protein
LDLLAVDIMCPSRVVGFVIAVPVQVKSARFARAVFAKVALATYMGLKAALNAFSADDADPKYVRINLSTGAPGRGADGGSRKNKRAVAI